MLRYLLPSVVEISAAKMEGTIVMNGKRLQYKNETKYNNLKEC